MLGVGVIGGLAVSSQSFDERESQLLWRCYGLAFQWFLLVIFSLYAIVAVFKWFAIAEDFLILLGAQWLGLTVSFLCILLGVAGLRLFRSEA